MQRAGPFSMFYYYSAQEIARHNSSVNLSFSRFRFQLECTHLFIVRVFWFSPMANNSKQKKRGQAQNY